MIAVDSSTFVDWLKGGDGEDVRRMRHALQEDALRLPPPVVSELLSYPRATPELAGVLEGLERLPILDGFWERAGKARAELLKRGHKAKLADALVAQCCIDADVPLIARDADFRRFAEACGLKLAV